MKLLNTPLLGYGWYQELLGELADDTETGKKSIGISGCVDSEKIHMISALSESVDASVIVTYSDLRAKEIQEEYLFYNRDAYYYPAKDLIFYQADINGNQLSVQRMKALKGILYDEKVTIITSVDALMTPMIPLKILQKNMIKLAKGSVMEEQAIAHKLVSMGYEKTAQVEGKGQFAIRGGIVDVFDLTRENPYRIELWGDEIDTIRSFDVLSQRSIEEVNEIVIFPGNEMVLDENLRLEGYKKIEKDSMALQKTLREKFKTEEAFQLKLRLEELRTQLLETNMLLNLESYIRYFYPDAISFLDLFQDKKLCVFLDEPARIQGHADAVELEFRESMMHRLEKGLILPKQADILTGASETFARIGLCRSVSVMSLENRKSLLPYDRFYSVNAKTLSSFNNSFSLLVEELRKLKKSGYRILLLSPSRTRAKRLAADLTEEGVIATYTENENHRLQAGEVMTFYGNIKKGFEYPDLKFIVISETDIFGTDKKTKRKRAKFSGGQKIKDYTVLKVGDYIIHENNGIGVYRGIEKVEVDHVKKDYMKIEYRDGGTLYVLATSLDMISLYADKDAKPPRLNKLGTNEWNKTKSKVQSAVGEVAKELVHLYAVRSAKAGHQFREDTIWQKEFEEMFPYMETDDQLTAIDATKKDMESSKIMDRLICGDVGYGKTEVAIRAAFKAVQEGKQVAYLVPTTILAQQHYTTFAERMKNYPIRVEVLSRFRTTKEIKAVLKDLAKGLVDIVIGTHRLLSADVVFKDLGLLVVDEEQRFGVTHKEKIKQMKENVDVLTLTATPIPRTLHMSLIGIRDMSILEEAPQDRLPIQTYVMEYNTEMVREAITRELARDGQVYYVYNRVNDIDLVAAEVAAIVPDARVAFAHGQMQERELESIIMDFINHEIDVLVATTIIETGIDIPNVNTMIIHDSDSMGLSQLYQLRGRVGRSNRTAYAFLMYRRNKMLKEIAEKRLSAIKEFTDLGSGFKIAMRDLELRGAGNLLGKQQHGHMQAVGYDLYCKMLEDAVRAEKGERKPELERTTTIDLNVDAYLPATYVVNEEQKLDLYKRIASISDISECDDMRDELKDRFGNVPLEAENLLRVAMIKMMAKQRYVSDIKGTPGRIRFIMRPDAPVAVAEIPVFLNEFECAMKFQSVGLPEFIYRYEIAGLVEQDEQLLLEKAEFVLEKMEMLFSKENVSEI